MWTFLWWIALPLASLSIFLLSRSLAGRFQGLSNRSGWSLGEGVMESLLLPLGRRIATRLPGSWLRRLDGLLSHAGTPLGWGAFEVVGLQASLLIFGSLALGLGRIASTPGIAFPVVLLALFPIPWLLGRAQERKVRIARELPFVLDLLTLVVEAGHDLSTGFAKVAEKMRPGPLQGEIAHSLRELRMGKSRRDALASMVARTGSVEVSRVVASLVQAERMGAPLGGTLRILAGQLRSERFLLAEKRAAQAPVKMLLPLVVFIFPAVFLVLFGPIVFASIGG